MNGSFKVTDKADALRNISVLRQACTTALAGLLTLGVGAGAAQSEISIGLGGLGGVSIGHSNGVQAGVNAAGVRAGATVGGNSVVAAGANVGGSHGVTAGAVVGGNTSVASVGANVGGNSGLGAGAVVGGNGGSLVTVGVGTGSGTTPGVPGGGGNNPGNNPNNPNNPQNPPVVPVVTDPAPVIPNTKKMRCAKGGNSQVYNGLQVTDRNGVVVGWVHDTHLDQQLRITGLRFQTVDNRCMGVNGGSYKVAGGVVIVNTDASRLR